MNAARLVIGALVLGLATGVCADTAKEMPGFALRNWDGKTVTPDSLVGARTILVFTYAKCVFGCPMITYQLQELDESLGHPEDVRYLHVSVNPELDTPEELLKHFEKHDIDPREDGRWMFLSGPEEETASVLAAYGIAVKRTPFENDVIVEPTPKVFVIDARARISNVFDTYQWDEKEMHHAIRSARGSLR
jgi:protein SCO1